MITEDQVNPLMISKRRCGNELVFSKNFGNVFNLNLSPSFIHPAAKLQNTARTIGDQNAGVGVFQMV